MKWRNRKRVRRNRREREREKRGEKRGLMSRWKERKVELTFACPAGVPHDGRNAEWRRRGGHHLSLTQSDVSRPMRDCKAVELRVAFLFLSLSSLSFSHALSTSLFLSLSLFNILSLSFSLSLPFSLLSLTLFQQLSLSFYLLFLFPSFLFEKHLN